jgi:hypothetical protein
MKKKTQAKKTHKVAKQLRVDVIKWYDGRDIVSVTMKNSETQIYFNTANDSVSMWLSKETATKLAKVLVKVGT